MPWPNALIYTLYVQNIGSLHVRFYKAIGIESKHQSLLLFQWGSLI
jgi:hypothetical protein